MDRYVVINNQPPGVSYGATQLSSLDRHKELFVIRLHFQRIICPSRIPKARFPQLSNPWSSSSGHAGRKLCTQREAGTGCWARGPGCPGRRVRALHPAPSEPGSSGSRVGQLLGTGAPRDPCAQPGALGQVRTALCPSDSARGVRRRRPARAGFCTRPGSFSL